MSLSREEIEVMLDLEIKETRVYREIKEEGHEMREVLS
jgi:predicted transposase YdaD